MNHFLLFRMSMSCNNYSESQSCCTDDTLGVVITSDFDFSSGYSSHVSSTHRKNNEIGRFITSVMNSKYAACHKKGVEPGTIETAIHDLLTHLNKVRLLSCGLVSCRRVSCGRMHITRQAPCSALTHLPPPHDR